MVDGRAAIHSMRLEPELLWATLERARPMIEARGTPARRHVFDRQLAMAGLIRHRYRVKDADLAGFRKSVELAEHTEEEREKDVGYSTYFLGWALWLRGELTEAREQLGKALAMAERIGETHLRSISLMLIILTALREHDTESRPHPRPEGDGSGARRQQPPDRGDGVSVVARLAGRAPRQGDRANRPDRADRPRHDGLRRPATAGCTCSR